MRNLDEYEADRKKQVAETATEYFNNGLSPYIRENFEEFLRELVESRDRVEALFEYVTEYKNEPDAAVLLSIGITFAQQLFDYWTKHAALSADRDTATAIDQMGDDRGSTKCTGK